MEERKRVLLADDDEFYLREFSRILAEDGFDVTAARTGEETLRAAASRERVDLLIVNLEIPGMLGFEVIKEIRRLKNEPNLPVLSLSSSFEQSNVEGMLRNLTVVRFLKKSTKPEEILFWVRAILFPREKFSRKSPRIIVDLPVAFQVADTEFTGRTFTLSEDGIFVRTRFVTYLDTHVKLRFAIPPGHIVQTDSIVVWINDFQPSKTETVPFGMGFRFVDLLPDDRQAIKQFVLDTIIG